MINEKKVVPFDEEVIFTNWLDQEVKGKWDFAVNGKIWNLKPGESHYFPLYLAQAFANQLVNDYYVIEEEKARKKFEKTKRAGEKFPGVFINPNDRQALIDKCIEKVPDPSEIKVTSIDKVQKRQFPLRKDYRNEEIRKTHGQLGHYVEGAINEKALEDEKKFAGI